MSGNGSGDGNRKAVRGAARNGELGSALRHWRDRIDPATVGIPAGRARRAAGLRREELALLAGMSVDYIIRLEQGRATSPSVQILTALARALRLTDAELRHLFVLAGQTPPTGGWLCPHITPGVQRLIDRMDGIPVGVYDGAWTLVSWNPLFAALTGDPSALPERERNVLWRHFTGLPDRVEHSPEQGLRFETAAVADLRAATARYSTDPGLRSLVAELRSRSARFAELWDSHVVGVHATDTKTFRHPDVGPLELDCDVLTDPGGALRIVVHTATPGTDAAEKLRLLAVIGIQSMGEPGVRR